MDFKTRLRELRKASALTQDQLAQHIGVTKQAVSQYERGIRQPEYETLEMLGDFFNVDLDYLLVRSDKTTLLPQSGYYRNPVSVSQRNDETAAFSQRKLTKDAEELLDDYYMLNEDGRKEARKRVKEMTEIDRYKGGTSVPSFQEAAG